MIITFLRQSWLVVVSSLIFGALVAGVEAQLRDRIAANAAAKMDGQMKILLPDAKTFEKKTAKDAQGSDIAYFAGFNAQGELVGYAFEASGGGFADVIDLLVATDARLNTLKGIGILMTNETPGFGDKMKDDEFKNQFVECPVAEKLTVSKTGNRNTKDAEIVAITGATISSEAVVKIVNDSLLRMRAVLKP